VTGSRSRRGRSGSHLLASLGSVRSVKGVVLLGSTSGERDEDEGDESREEGDPPNDDEGKDGALILVCRDTRRRISFCSKRVVRQCDFAYRQD
jgi:hypothetical protein